MDWRSESENGADNASIRDGATRGAWAHAVRSVGRVRATLIPLLVAFLAFLYLALREPFFGGNVITRIFLVLIILGAVASLAFRYAKSRSTASTSDSAEDPENTRKTELHRTLMRLESGLANVGSADGVSALRALSTEWFQLERLFSVRKATDPLSLGQAAVIAEETFQRGISALSDARDLLSSADLNGRKKIEWEITELTDEIAATPGDGPGAEIRRRNLELRQERLEAIDDLRLASEKLVYQARRCEASLQRTRMDLASMRFGGTDERIDDVVNALNETMQQVKDVQEELARYGY